MTYTTCDISVVIVVKFMRCAAAAGAFRCGGKLILFTAL